MTTAESRAAYRALPEPERRARYRESYAGIEPMVERMDALVREIAHDRSEGMKAE